MDGRFPNSQASSAAARAKAVPKTKKKQQEPSRASRAPAPAQFPANLLLANQVPTISSDSDGSIDDIVFDNTGMRVGSRALLAYDNCMPMPTLYT